DSAEEIAFRRCDERRFGVFVVFRTESPVGDVSHAVAEKVGRVDFVRGDISEVSRERRRNGNRGAHRDYDDDFDCFAHIAPPCFRGNYNTLASAFQYAWRATLRSSRTVPVRSSGGA